jgi:hypothetical protein
MTGTHGPLEQDPVALLIPSVHRDRLELFVDEQLHVLSREFRPLEDGLSRSDERLRMELNSQRRIETSMFCDNPSPVIAAKRRRQSLKRRGLRPRSLT